MNTKRAGSLTALLAAGAIVLSGCAVNETAADETTEPGATEPTSSLSGNLVGAGSSAVGAAQTAWIAEFQMQNPEVTVTYDPTGSGAGRETFQAGGSDFAGTDRAFNDEEIAAGGFEACAPDSGIVQLPLYISPIAIIFNVEGIDTLNMTPEVVAGIFAEEITTWNDPAIAELNEGVELPAEPITPVHRSDDSGTTENFTDYLFQAAPDVWTYEPDGVWPLESGEAAQGTSGVVDAVTNGTNTIGYADASRAGDLGTVAVEVGGEFVPFSPEAAAAIVDASEFVEGRPDFDLSIDLNRDPETPAYPVVLVAYLVGCETYADPAQAELVKAYFTYMASEEGQATAAENAGSAPISDALFERVTAAIDVIS
ncbi:MAG TPA: phosphate ABC transporter substrate-binding protein PstS [Microcella sp.]|nr:phosphate ABC transporter substrate-binding protein PstS [Microcella sp.]